MEDPTTQTILRGVSVRWLKLSSTLWCIAVRPARRCVTRECLLNFLDVLDWYHKGEVKPEEFQHIYEDWMRSTETEPETICKDKDRNVKKKEVSSSSGSASVKNTFTLTHLRTVLLQDRQCFAESKLVRWIRLLLKESQRRLMHRPICYTRSLQNVKQQQQQQANATTTDLNSSTATGVSASSGGGASTTTPKKSAPVNPSSLEYTGEEWSRAVSDIFRLLDVNKHYHWGFEEVLFFASVLTLARTRFEERAEEEEAEEEDGSTAWGVGEEAICGALALDKLSAKALFMLGEMGASYSVSCAQGGGGSGGSRSSGKSTGSVRTPNKASSSSSSSSSSMPPTAVVTEAMFAGYILKKRLGLSALRALHSLLRMVLRELRKLVTDEECAFDGLAHDVPALWHRSVSIASGLELEMQAGYGYLSRAEKEKEGREEAEDGWVDLGWDDDDEEFDHNFPEQRQQQLQQLDGGTSRAEALSLKKATRARQSLGLSAEALQAAAQVQAEVEAELEAQAYRNESEQQQQQQEGGGEVDDEGSIMSSSTTTSTSKRSATTTLRKSTSSSSTSSIDPKAKKDKKEKKSKDKEKDKDKKEREKEMEKEKTEEEKPAVPVKIPIPPPPQPQTPLMHICLFLLADASRLVPASLHIIDDGLHDLAFALGQNEEGESAAELLCAAEMRAAATRMHTANSHWGTSKEPVPSVETLRKSTEEDSRRAGRLTPTRGGASASLTPPRGKTPALSDSSPVLALYLGVLVEYKNLHLQLCDALVHMHRVFWTRIDRAPQKYPALQYLDSLLPPGSGDNLLGEVMSFYRPAAAAAAAAERGIGRGKLSSSSSGGADSRGFVRPSKEQIAARLHAERMLKEKEEDEELENERQRRAQDAKRRATARKSAQARARVVQEEAEEQERRRQLRRQKVEEEEAKRLALTGHTVLTSRHEKKQQLEEERKEEEAEDPQPPQSTKSAVDPRDADPDHLFWKLRSARNREEKEELLARLKTTRYGDVGGVGAEHGEEGCDDSAIGFYDHSPNQAQRHLQQSGSHSVAGNVITERQRRASTAGPGGGGAAGSLPIRFGALKMANTDPSPPSDSANVQRSEEEWARRRQNLPRKSAVSSLFQPATSPPSPIPLSAAAAPLRRPGGEMEKEELDENEERDHISDAPPPSKIDRSSNSSGRSKGQHSTATATAVLPGQPTSINDMLERGIDFDAAKQAKELRQRLRAMSGVTNEEARFLLELGKKTVHAHTTGAGGAAASVRESPGGGNGSRPAFGVVVSGTPNKRVPGLTPNKTNKNRIGRSPAPSV